MIWAWAQIVHVLVSPKDRVRLTALLGDRNRPLEHIQRAKVILFSADRLPVLTVARRSEVSGLALAAPLRRARR